ncbi:type I-F CRISPR-associated helicase Cas3f [Pectobacterium parmentieri]|uniref:type I-F CRISPR-associated helicase Cas3f n=1 Tax=Pectobacterium parmentieri TaxID=1905730 RepID=UPI000CDE3855|nr:type I-F CRISPR-associated helicase Cas3f [Pectobacterium parmentieri]AYH07062.1 type I-F CRISPR-associated helicase Cas3 [Pectobacterium parmentieri]AYH15873.1 type I-F CRISPR-associated helicase Cas3 [Pectobacterium parmentieri]AYH24582.1 type I-F CRISPR-associated helicase Cas3 [Pectobacterium parmentieri]MBN3176205.1 type I-F CRISPR-associated helicase Cas3 [Pectobacterium parmentieri]POW28864.1 type I-F CRISPR-associated helicase Cas3 [Pectobacterium parmentieri]
MNILLISECNKRALVETRRILDQFAERKGERSWQTAITLEGLNTLRKLLRKTARRNTAVACHWIRSTNHTELLWVVGNLRRFNAQGSVPTNTTSRDVLRTKDENPWHSAEVFSLLAAIAGLFHDVGKANALFQAGLSGTGPHSQPYRHEWVSLRLFQAFVGEQDDKAWLTMLSTITPEAEVALLATLQHDKPTFSDSPFRTLPPLAQTVAWLIVSHHRLPVFNKAVELAPNSSEPQLSFAETWLTDHTSAQWNAINHYKTHWTSSEREQNWQFPNGTPLRSAVWREKARKFAGRALKLPSFIHFSQLDQRLTVHLARLALMLADHHYSAGTATLGWQDITYPVWANTDRKTREYKQRLDEHCVGVGQNALLLGRSLPHLRDTLPAITRHKGFRQRSTHPRFRWQDRAFDLAGSIRETTKQHGFFGINMASTGRGKTFANARIMYGLSDEAIGCRFSVALGLRTLTLQTGDALRQRLKLDEDDLAVLIGSQAVQDLHEMRKENQQRQQNTPQTGSESADPLFSEHQYVRYDGSLDDGRLKAWLERSPTLHQLLSAPVLITTIDHLMPATEGLRGGHQIAPMLRLLTSDLVLDEPDDFGLEDLPALCRLVNWAGMLGSRVLLSSATLPPALIRALFDAYLDGRAAWQQAYGTPNAPLNVCCGWFDEFDCQHAQYGDVKDFMIKHDAFVHQRLKNLTKDELPLRFATIVPVSSPSKNADDVHLAVAQAIHPRILDLHSQHHQQHESGKTVSLGLVRMANIDPLVAATRQLLSIPSPPDTCIHYCVYHSQHPLAMRSYIEQRLDAALMRNDADALWQVEEIRQAIEKAPQQHHVFVVLATSVAEVGRDHDYDWAIVEPSSMRSLIQLAGRILRHRQDERYVPKTPNIYLLSHNIRALRGEDIAYCKPGFESQDDSLDTHDLHQLLQEKEYRHLSAAPRIVQPASFTKPLSLVALEHAVLGKTLLGLKNKKLDDLKRPPAAFWWRAHPHWNGELQRRTPFRQSAKDEAYTLWIADDDEEPVFMVQDDGPSGWKQNDIARPVTLNMAEGVSAWIEPDYHALYQRLAEEKQWELSWVSARFGEIRLREEKDWYWHPLLGVFGALS